MKKKETLALALLAATVIASGAASAARDSIRVAEGGWNSWYGPSRDYRDDHRSDRRGDWAVGTFHGQNGANGIEETVTIRPDGSAEVRSRGEAPRHGTFEGETLTLGSRISKVEPARAGIVIDGAYYQR